MNSHEVLIKWFKEQYPENNLLGFGICLSGVSLTWINKYRDLESRIYRNKFIEDIRKGIR